MSSPQPPPVTFVTLSRRHACARNVARSRALTTISSSRQSASKSVNSQLRMADQISEHEDALIELFLCLDLADLAVCSRVCRRWHALLSNGNSSIWENQFYVLVPEKMQKSELLEALPSYQAKVQAYCFAWNPNDCSKNISIKDDGFTFHRRPVPQSTDAARTRKGFTSGRHCWEVWWEKPFGSHALVGVATQNAPLQQRGYISLVGMNRYSWGWNLSDNKLWHGGKTVGSYPRNLAITCQVTGNAV